MPTASPRRRALLALLWVASVHAAGLFLFTTGFFLTRFEVPDVSDCHAPPSVDPTDAAAPPHHLRSAADAARAQPDDPRGCWMPRRFRRVVFVVVDALRFDFVQSPSARPVASGSFFLNRLPVLNETLRAQPANALLLKFVADAPTMTMQRLKGLTTGGLPTFLDIKDNMASSEITEDNLLLQMQRARRPVVFMGDDTWEALYRNAFARKYAFDSFNVKDLHSVDRGVVRHLFPELRDQSDWELLIAHFLGVDHVGHTHGPSSPFMAEKLDEMNAILTRLLDELSRDQHSDTLLLVMGDHGMSADGNHGGASDDETGAALFAYSRQPLVDPAQAAAWPREVPQVDLVPTIALLAGLPVPFGNLGAVIPQLFRDRDTLAQALRLNVAQVRRYLLTYSAASKLPQSEFDHLERLYDAVRALEDQGDTSDNLDELVAAQQAYLREALALGRSVWTQFDLCGMGWGITLLIVAQALVVWHLVGDPMRWSRAAAWGGLGGAAVGLLIPGALIFVPRTLLARALALAALGSCVVPMSLGVATRQTSVSAPLRSRAYLFSSVSLVAFVTVLLHALALLSNSYIVAEDRVMHFLTASVGLYLVYAAHRARSRAAGDAAVVFLVASRVASAVDPPNIIHSATTLGRTWLPLALLVGGAAIRLWAKHDRRHLVHAAASLLAVAWAGAACACYWLWLPIASSLWRLGLPRSVFLLAWGALALRVRSVCFAKHAATDATALALLMALSYALVLGPSAPLTVACLAAQHWSFARVAASAESPSLAWVALWCAVCYQSFFTTGHQNTFTSLQNAAAFVGFDDFRFYWAGALLGANTFGNYALALPALASARASPAAAARPLLAAVAYFALNALVSTAFVALQRRHLMVWAIFAPKFIFDGATLLVVELLAGVALAIVPIETSPVKTHTPSE